MDYPAPRNAMGTEILPGETPKKSFYRRGEHGFIEMVDTDTGVVISVQESFGVIPRAEFVELEIDGRKVLIQSGMNLPEGSIKVKHPFSQVLADVIVQKIVDGAELSNICKTPGFPDRITLARWRRENPDFEKEIKFAKKMRAEMLRDEMSKTSLEALGAGKDALPGYKLRVDTLKWLVEKENPAEYGAKLEVSGEIGVVQMVIETGIRRRGDPGFTEPIAPEVIDVTEENALAVPSENKEVVEQ